MDYYSTIADGLRFGQARSTQTLLDQIAETIPEEVWLRIFTYLEPGDLSRAAQVCQHWSQLISQSETLWKSKCLSVTDMHVKQQILADRNKTHTCWKDVYKINYGRQFTKRLWLEGKVSNITSVDQLPVRSFCLMDVDTWGEIFENELRR